MYDYILVRIKYCKKQINQIKEEERKGKKRDDCSHRRIDFFENELNILKTEVQSFLTDVEENLGKNYVDFIEKYYFNDKSGSNLAGDYDRIPTDTVRRTVQRFSKSWTAKK